MPLTDPEERARKLLVESLNEEQRATFKKNKVIQLRGSEGNTYEIRCIGGISGNISWLVDGRTQGVYCAHPALRDPEGRRLPKDDLILGQLLHLVTDENGFLSESYLQSGSFPPSFVRVPRSSGFHQLVRPAVRIRIPEEWCPCPLCTEAIARLRTVRP